MFLIRKTIRERRIQNVLVEFKPVNWGNFGITRQEGVLELVQTFKKLKMMCVTLMELHECQRAKSCNLDVWDPADSNNSFKRLLSTDADVDVFCTGSHDLQTLWRDIPVDFPSV